MNSDARIDLSRRQEFPKISPFGKARITGDPDNPVLTPLSMKLTWRELEYFAWLKKQRAAEEVPLDA